MLQSGEGHHLNIYFDNISELYKFTIIVKWQSTKFWFWTAASSIYKFGLSVCLFVCLFVSNKRQNGWTDRAQIFCGTSRDHREGLWMIKISNICLHQNWIFINFLKILKIHEIFCENPLIIFVLFYNVHKENMFTINLEDGREAPYKASN